MKAGIILALGCLIASAAHADNYKMPDVGVAPRICPESHPVAMIDAYGNVACLPPMIPDPPKCEPITLMDAFGQLHLVCLPTVPEPAK
jgi:hypothetical protein